MAQSRNITAIESLAEQFHRFIDWPGPFGSPFERASRLLIIPSLY